MPCFVDVFSRLSLLNGNGRGVEGSQRAGGGGTGGRGGRGNCKRDAKLIKEKESSVAFVWYIPAVTLTKTINRRSGLSRFGCLFMRPGYTSVKRK